MLSQSSKQKVRQTASASNSSEIVLIAKVIVLKNTTLDVGHNTVTASNSARLQTSQRASVRPSPGGGKMATDKDGW